MRRYSAILPLLMTPALVAAQSLADIPPAQPQLVDQLLYMQRGTPAVLGNLQAMPLWGTPDGRVLAIVASVDNSAPAKPQMPQISSAADWKLVDVTNFVSSGFVLNLNPDASAYATFGRGAILGPTFPLAGFTCNPLSMPAIAGDVCANSSTLARSGTMQFGTDWTILDRLDLDLSYGLGWFKHDTTPGVMHQPIDVFGALGSPDFPTLLIPGLEGSNVQNAELGASGRWRFDGPASLDVGASLSHMQLSSPLGNTPLTSLNQAAVTFGMRYGSFSGNVTGHLLGPADSFNQNSRWAGLDIGFSWRTPWQGKFSVGTQNLWSSGALPNIADPAAREVDSNQARIPYVQYHQDL